MAKKWRFIPDDSSAVHEDGIHVKFFANDNIPDVAELVPCCKCWDKNGREWIGFASTDKLNDLIRTLKDYKIDSEGIAEIIARLGRESGEFFVSEINKKN
jgi:hypothetical protein